MKISVSILLGVALSLISIYLRENKDKIDEVSKTNPVELKKKYHKVPDSQLSESEQLPKEVVVKKNEMIPEIEVTTKKIEEKVLAEDKILIQKMSEIEKKRKAILEESQSAKDTNMAEDNLAEKNLQESIEISRKAFEAESSPMKVKR